MRGPSPVPQIIVRILVIVGMSTVADATIAQPSTVAAVTLIGSTPTPRAVIDGTSKSADWSIEASDSRTVFEQTSFAASLAEQPEPTRGWSDARSVFADHGLTFDLSTTQFYQSVTTGGLTREGRYGGRNDYFINVDAEKVGLWKGTSFTLHGETRYGESANSLTGALLPVNLLLALPQPNGSVTALTGVKLTQVLSENLLAYAGKLNTLDDFTQPLTDAGSLSGFQNTAMVYNPVYARTIPYSTFGAGFAYLNNTERVFEMDVYDTNDTPTSSGFDTFLNNGVTVFAQGILPTKFFDLPGHQGLSGTYSTGTYTDLSPSAYLDPIKGLRIRTTPKTGSWCVAYNMDQALFVSKTNPRRMWGLFGNLGIADNNPSPVRWFANAGISGASAIAGRNADTFGAAYFHVGVSNSLKDLSPILRPIGDEHGVELYYNVAITPQFGLSPDIQIIKPFQDRANSPVIVGLRAKIDF